VALALIFYGGIAGGAMLTYLAGASSRILEYLFGSVVTVTDGELLATGLVTGAVLCITVGLRRHLFAVCYDEETARVSGLPVRALNLLIALTAAVTVAVTMRVVGILLVSGMLVLPVAAVQQVTRSFVATMIGSLVLGMVLSVGGLIVAFYLDVVPGATIVLGAIAVFALATALSTGRRLRGRARVA
jgi:zinc transport system permease protein